MNRILYWPKVRQSIQSHFEYLLDEEFRKTWFDSSYKHAFWDSLEYYVFDYLLNIPGSLEPHDALGISLYNAEEAKVLEKYFDWYNDTFEGNMPDNYYVNHPEWTRLLEWTREILDMMEVNNKKYDFEAEIKQWDDTDPVIIRKD